MRCFLVDKVLREKRYDALGRMQFRKLSLNKRTREGGVALKQMKVKRDDLKVLAEGVSTQVCIQQTKVRSLRKLLEDAQNALKIKKERDFQLTDDIVAASIHHFEEEKRWVFLLYLHLYLTPLDPFKVVLDRELVGK